MLEKKENNIIIYQSNDKITKIEVLLENENLWLSQKQMAELYQCSRTNIIEHIKNIYQEGELEKESTCQYFRQVQLEGNREVKREIPFYNLDMIISLGYRIKSSIATKFRMWATERLKEYIIKGFSIDDDRLKNLGGGNYWKELLDRIRDIRSSEKVMYRQVLDLYATAIDYDPNSKESINFFKIVQNKLHFAAHGNTASEIIFLRVDSNKPFVGLTNFKAEQPTQAEAMVAKNFLEEKELKILNNLVAAYFDLAELNAIEEKKMYMADYIQELNTILSSTGREVLNNAGTVSNKQAKEKAQQEYKKYQAKTLSSVEKQYLKSIKALEKQAKPFLKWAGGKNQLISQINKEISNAGTVSKKQAKEKAQQEYKKYQAKTLRSVEKQYLKSIKALEKQAKPFLKWAGGKNQLISQINKEISSDVDTYIEPFVGAGALLFYVLNNHPNIKNIIINDINTDLVNVYKSIKNNVDQLISILDIYQKEYYELLDNIEYKKEYFYKKRTLFNKRTSNQVIQSAIFIFLNKTCFNGLYRVNKKNEFNVPIGSYKKPLICDHHNLVYVNKALQKVEILNGDYEKTVSFIRDKTLFYFDPPYKPLNKTSNFNSYAKDEFNDNEQIRLANFCKKIDTLGCDWILSNSDIKGENLNNNFFDSLFYGFKIKRVLAKRSINSNASKRGQLTELLITNKKYVK